VEAQSEQGKAKSEKKKTLVRWAKVWFGISGSTLRSTAEPTQEQQHGDEGAHCEQDVRRASPLRDHHQHQHKNRCRDRVHHPREGPEASALALMINGRQLERNLRAALGAAGFAVADFCAGHVIPARLTRQVAEFEAVEGVLVHDALDGLDGLASELMLYSQFSTPFQS
jgi:hypothetical protein